MNFRHKRQRFRIICLSELAYICHWDEENTFAAVKHQLMKYRLDISIQQPLYTELMFALAPPSGQTCSKQHKLLFNECHQTFHLQSFYKNNLKRTTTEEHVCFLWLKLKIRIRTWTERDWTSWFLFTAWSTWSSAALLPTWSSGSGRGRWLLTLGWTEASPHPQTERRHGHVRISVYAPFIM